MGSEMLGVPCSEETALAGVAEEASAAKSSMRTGAKQMERFCGFILLRACCAVTLDRWSITCTRQS